MISRKSKENEWKGYKWESEGSKMRKEKEIEGI
jgi:hypothetical protein